MKDFISEFKAAKNDIEKIQVCQKNNSLNFKINIDNDVVSIYIEEEDEIINFDTYGEELIKNLFTSINLKSDFV